MHTPRLETPRQPREHAPSAQERARPAWRGEAGRLLVLFVGTRLALTAVGLIAREFEPGPVWHPQPAGVGPLFSRFPFLDLWGQWDTSWYLSIARVGYSPEPLEGPFANYGFFPLYPYLARWVGWFLGSTYVGGLVVSNAAFLVACGFLYQLVMLDDDVHTARRAVKYLFAAPAAFLFSAMLTESLYLALVVMCFYFARTKRWWAVGIAGFFLALSRPLGVLTAIPLLWIYFQQRGFSVRRIRLNVLWLALLPVGIGVFMWVNHRLTGDPLAFTKVQKTAWGHHPQNALTVLRDAISSPNAFFRFHGWYAIALLTLTLAFLRRFGTAYALFVLLSLGVQLFYGVPWVPMIRYSVVVFPFYIVGARFTDQRPALDQAVTIAAALLQGFVISQWANASPLVT